MKNNAFGSRAKIRGKKEKKIKEKAIFDQRSRVQLCTGRAPLRFVQGSVLTTRTTVRPTSMVVHPSCSWNDGILFNLSLDSILLKLIF